MEPAAHLTDAEFLEAVVQNDYLIDGHVLPTGKRLRAIAAALTAGAVPDDLLDSLVGIRAKMDGVPMGSPAYEAAVELDAVVKRLARGGFATVAALNIEARLTPAPPKPPAVPTDLDAFKAMLTRAGVAFQEGHDDGAPALEAIPEKQMPRPARPASITLIVQGGYSGFYSVFTFKMDGTLVAVEAFE